MNLNSIATAMIILNIGFAAFAAAAPAGNMPWWLVAGITALNAMTHALPNQSLVTTVKGIFK